jgi:HAD superfamily hydrolase (TIGR01450 family)
VSTSGSGSTPGDTKPAPGSPPAAQLGSTDGRALADGFDTFLFDLDGVVYVGSAAVPGAPEIVSRLRDSGQAIAFVTNNASRTPDTVADQLTGLGIRAKPDEVVSSAQAAAGLVADRVEPGAKVLVIGGEGLRIALEERGLTVVSTAAEQPAAVAQGFHPDVGWRLLAEGAYALARDIPWIASNVDRTLPTDGGLAPGNGTLVEVIRMATGRDPVIAGKPARPIFDETLARLHGPRGSAARALVIGDRLDTDIEGAYNAELPSLLVLTGVSTIEDLLRAPVHQRPTYISSDLHGLYEPHPEVVADNGRYHCGAWTAEVTGGNAVLTAAEDSGGGKRLRDDGVRALALACWNTDGPVDIDAAVRALV